MRREAHVRFLGGDPPRGGPLPDCERTASHRPSGPPWADCDLIPTRIRRAGSGWDDESRPDLARRFFLLAADDSAGFALFSAPARCGGGCVIGHDRPRGGGPPFLEGPLPMTTTSSSAHPHTDFLTLLPAIERHAHFVFRGHPPAEREEATAVAIAAAFAGYVRLAAQGRNPVRDFASGLVTYAVLHAKSGRQVGSPSSTTDALSPLAQRKRAFRVEALPTSSGVERDRLNSTADRRRHDEFEEWLRDNTRSAVPDQVAFRLDFPPFLAGLGRRDRTLARFLALGHSAHVAAARFGMSEGRVSQLRRAWRERWCKSQGEDVDNRL